MIEIESMVFTAVATRLREVFPGIFVTGDLIAEPDQFPCLAISEDDNSSYSNANDFQKKDHYGTVMYTANAYSNLEVGRKKQAKSVMTVVDEVMLSLGFVRLMNSPMENINRTISRRVARWRGIVSEEGRIYQK